MKERQRSITFIVTWGTTRVVSRTVGLPVLGSLVVLVLFVFSFPGFMLVNEQLALSLDRGRYEAAVEDYQRLTAELENRLDSMIAYEEKVSITFGRGSASYQLTDGSGGRGGGESLMEGESDAGAAALRDRQRILSADWDRKVEWLYLHFSDLIGEIESNEERALATPTISPVRGGWITSRYGYRESPFTGRREFHQGLDITHRLGTPIIAPAAGRVTFVGRDPIWGLHVKIEHGYDFETFYGHMRQAAVTLGQWINRGEVIGYLGSTGRATGPHLHYQVNVRGIPVNPLNHIFDLDRSQ